MDRTTAAAACLLLLSAIPLPAQEQAKQDFAPPNGPPSKLRTDLFISGVYPHLTTYGIYSQNGAHNKLGHNECGIGAIVPWAGKLWMVNYAPHMPRGSEHKLFSISPDLRLPLTIHAESVGGTPAGRMIHQESNQLLIAHYLIDAQGKVRVISPEKMPIRVTAIARHLSDPANNVYYVDMEGSIWEANVRTLAVKQLFKKPVPGWHGKGGYTSQGRLVVSNNGELSAGNYNDLLVGGPARDSEERGVLAEYDGKNWKIVERRQFTEVTGPSGIAGGSDGNEPLWAVGWDRRSLRLKLLDDGRWYTYLLPKAAYCNDASHGWYTEWPRIREITGGRWMMDMHGMFFDFPKSFSAGNSAGIRPIGSHLRYVPDFCGWNGKLVLATDETSIQGNDLAGQPQSNLWFGDYDDLKSWGPANGYGGPWLEDEVQPHSPSDPFLIAGFDRRVLHLATGRRQSATAQLKRASDQQPITSLPSELSGLPLVTVKRGDWHRPAPGFSFRVDGQVTVFLAVDRRGDPKLPAQWKLTDLTLTWGQGYQDRVYAREFPAGEIAIPGNATEHKPGDFGMPHTAFVAPKGSTKLTVTAMGDASVAHPPAGSGEGGGPVTFTLQIDKQGNGSWTDLATVQVPARGYVAHLLPENLTAEWLRLSVDRPCVATAFLHQTTARFADGSLPANRVLFAGLAEATDKESRGAVVYAAKRNRNLHVIADDQQFDFTKAGFGFAPTETDEKLKALLKIEPHFTVDEASVVLNHNGKRLRLPKGYAAFDRPFAFGWPRSLREVESERVLANIHGTFYEVPLVTNGDPPAFNLMRPVASHSKQICDYCSWNGLVVMTGVVTNAASDGHVFSSKDGKAAVWLGAIDDLWKLGKPVGRGGPWRQTPVKAGVASDPYLMTGYDRKSVELSHTLDQPLAITLQVDIDGSGRWFDYRRFDVAPKVTTGHQFPTGFSACWIRAVSDRDATASVLLTYQ